MKVPLVDLGLQSAEIAEEVAAGFRTVIERSAYINGSEVAGFEAAFARLCGVPHCVGVANGTDALELALRALGVGVGDEVVVPANSFNASAAAVRRAGARPVFVDVRPGTLLIDAEATAAAVGPGTRALMPVHLFGQIAPMEELLELAARHGLAVVEDAAQAHGATRNGEAAGSWGEAAGFSFYPGKNLGAYGDGGAVVTSSDEVAATLRRLGNFGTLEKYDHDQLGFNSRLDTLQAVVLTAKLERLVRWNDERVEAAARYDELLAGIDGVGRPLTLDGNSHVWHLYVVEVPARDLVHRRLLDNGIGAGIHYPRPLHLQGAFADLGYREGDMPVAEAAARRILSLPMFPGITLEQQELVATTLRAALAGV